MIGIRPAGWRRGAAILCAVLVLVAGWRTPVAAAPDDPGDEGGTPTLGQVLEAANKGFLDAQAALEESRRRQQQLTEQSASVEAKLAPLTEQTAVIAVAAYRTGGLRTMSALLDSDSPDSFMSGVTMINVLASRNDRLLRELHRLRDELATSKAAIDVEVRTQQEQVTLMDKKRKEAERALAAVGGRATGGFVSASSPLAKPAPRRADGTWPPESCIIDDPTTSGCVTARTLHALQQAKSAGFTRFVSCYRSGGPYEHPKGRACDWSAQAGGFGGVASGGDRTYGNNLAAYFVRNANALGVLYVIWFRQIWMPSTGWRAYESGNGDPSSDHTNHVHLSMY